MRILLSLLALPLVACDAVTPIDAENAAPVADRVDAAPIAPGARPVRIGEAGPSFAACPTRGTVVNTGGGDTLAVRAAPFNEAEQVAGLAEGARVFVCTQTIDQRWMGIVTPPANQPDADCGLAARISSPRAYDGPCPAGWITSSFVRVSAR